MSHKTITSLQLCKIINAFYVPLRWISRDSPRVILSSCTLAIRLLTVEEKFVMDSGIMKASRRLTCLLHFHNVFA